MSDRKPLPDPTRTVAAGSPTLPEAIDRQPLNPETLADLHSLYAAKPPINDYRGAARDFGFQDVNGLATPQTVPRVGERASFFTADGNRAAELVYQDDLAAYWVESGLVIDQDALANAAGKFQERYYPLLAQTLGEVLKAAQIGTPPLTILHLLAGPESDELGYFTERDQFPRSLFSDSNERDMVYLNMGELGPEDPLYIGTLLHEVQHVIQWKLDGNEERWLNEGLSQVLETIAGLNTVDPASYLERTHIRLDSWSGDETNSAALYGGSYLYLLYFWEQLGNDALAELARSPANGLSAVRAVLSGYRPNMTLEQFTADWATALYLDGVSSEQRYTIEHQELSRPFFANRARQLPFETVSSMEQFSVDYIDLDFSGPATLSFSGDSSVELLDPPANGEPFWYALPSNSARSQLTAVIDLSDLPRAELSFFAWCDLEPGYDFAYLSVSADGGTTWRLLESPVAVPGDYGPAWSGSSNGWQEESFDLSEFVGRPIHVRFDVLTDFEVLGMGFAVGDLHVSQVETQPTWQASGFVSTGHLLPQMWEIRLIREGEEAQVIPISLDEFNNAQLEVNLGKDGGALIILPLTPFVTTEADYWLSLRR